MIGTLSLYSKSAGSAAGRPQPFREGETTLTPDLIYLEAFYFRLDYGYAVIILASLVVSLYDELVI